MKTLRSILLIAQLTAPFQLFAAQPESDNSIPATIHHAKMGHAPFGFQWGQGIEDVRKIMPWAKKLDGDGLVCLKPVGSIITKCVSSYAPKQLLTEGEYTLLFDKNGLLFEVSFEHYTTISSKSTNDGSDPSYVARAILNVQSYIRYVKIIESKYGKASAYKPGEKFSTYSWLNNGIPYISLGIETAPKTSIKITYSSPMAQKAIRENDSYHANYEASVL